jgi:hypothetical protein
MNLNCPYCGETIPYDRSVAGRSVACSYCENPINMPLVEELPEELQEAFGEDEARQQQKQQKRYHRKQEQLLKKIEKEEKQKQKQEAQRKRQELQKKAESAQGPVAEELAVKKRYPALRALARWNRVIAGFLLLGYLASLVMVRSVLLLVLGVVPGSLMLGAAIVLAVPTALTIVIVWAGGELIRVFLDIADDVRMTRLLTKKQVYRKSD